MMVIRVCFEIQASSLPALSSHIAAEVAVVRQLPGCLAYAFWQDPQSPTRWMLYEEWADADSFAAYKASPLFAAAGAVLFPMMVGRPDSAYFDAARVGP